MRGRSLRHATTRRVKISGSRPCTFTLAAAIGFSPSRGLYGAIKYAPVQLFYGCFVHHMRNVLRNNVIMLSVLARGAVYSVVSRTGNALR
jgi:hypothetical protein